MRSIAVFGGQAATPALHTKIVEAIELDGIRVNCGLLHTDGPCFSNDSEDNRLRVLVRVKLGVRSFF